MRHFVREDIVDLIDGIGREFQVAGRILLVGSTSHVWEGFLSHTPEIEVTFCSEDESAPAQQKGRAEFDRLCSQVGDAKQLIINTDSPEDYVPLLDGHRERAIPVSDPPPSLADQIKLVHFDPYSVAFRFVARGDEPDYHVALRSLSCGWMKDIELDRLIDDFLPKLNKETIQQDPAEFRRKYKGLQQLRKATRPGLVHRFSAT